MRRIATVVALLLVASCKQTTDIAFTDAGTCEVPCGAACCSAEERCAGDGQCCRPACAGKTCGDDGCGGSCGACESGWICNADKGTCECAAESDEAFCDRLNKRCGTVTAPDFCGTTRSVDCGVCGEGERCNAMNQCETCPEETQTEFCDRLEKECGQVTAPDACGTERSFDCGTCPSPKTCNAGHKCECTGESETDLCTVNLVRCGSLTAADQCGTVRDILECGPCGIDDVCTGGTCCTPASNHDLCLAAGKACGPLTVTDNCGTSRAIDECGPCAVTGAVCSAGSCCTPETETALCQAQGKTCGALTAVDGCGTTRDIASCGSCNIGDTCSGGTCVACTEETDAAFCQRLNKPCGPVTALDSCGITRTVRNCGSCGAGQFCDVVSNACTPDVPTNDDCTGVTALALTNGREDFIVDTTLAHGSGDGTCNASSGFDVVYSFTLGSVEDVDILATPLPGSAAAPNLYVRTSCDQKTSEVTGACVKSGGTNTPVALRLPSLPPGTYYLWVDGWSSSTNGPMRITMAANAPVSGAPANDLCSAAEPLVFNGDTAVATGSTLGAANDSTGACGTMAQGDVFYWFTLGADARVQIKVTSKTPVFTPAVYVRSDCSASAVESVCIAGAHGEAVVPTPDVLTAGTYYVVVDGTAGNGGGFDLEIKKGVTVNGTCATVQALAFNSSGEAIVVGDNRLGNDTIVSSCNDVTTGRDLVWSFEVPPGAPQDVMVTATQAVGSNLQPALSIRTSCDQQASEIACTATDSLTNPLPLLARSLAAGTYYVWLDARRPDTNGPFMMKVSLRPPPPPPPNDVCVGGAIPLGTLDLSSRTTVTIPGTTRGAINDSTGSCGTMKGGDVAFTFTLDVDARLTATVVGDNATPGWQPAFYILDGCPGSTPTPVQTLCASSATATSITAMAKNLSAGTYYVIVDSLNDLYADFALTLSADTPVNNDNCTAPNAAYALTFASTAPGVMTATVNSDTNWGTDDGDTQCNSLSGKDLVYLVTVPPRAIEDIKVEVTPQPGSGLRPSLEIRTSCTDKATSVACANASAPGAASTIEAKARRAGVYYVVVDGQGWSTNGPFTMTVTRTALPPIGPEDTCDAVPSIPLTDGHGTVSGTTANAIDDYTGTCTSMPGPDVVYSVTLGAPSSLAVSVTGTGFNPAVYIRSACTRALAADEKGCSFGTTTTRAVSLPVMPAGTYYVFVDSTSATAFGTYSLDVQTGVPITNFTCAAAEALEFDPLTKTASVVSDTSVSQDNNTSSTCAGAGTGKDLAYYFEIPAHLGRQDVSIDVTPLAGSGLRPNPVLRAVCGEKRSELGCAHANSVTAANLSASRLAPGTYYLIVDGSGSSSGAFTMTVTLTDSTATPPPNDSCANPQMLSFVSDTASAIGDTRAASPDSTGGSCGDPGTGPDVVYYFSTSREYNVQVTVTPDSGSSLKPRIYVRSAHCADPSAEVGCAASSSSTTAATASLSRLPAGTYYVIVDSPLVSGLPTATGSFSLTVTTTIPLVPPNNDSCSQAEPLNFNTTTNTATVTASTVNATDDYAGTCSSGTALHNGGDVVYSFSLGTTRHVTATVVRDSTASPTFQPAVYIRRASSCTSSAAADELGCDSSGSSGTTAATVGVLPAGDYSVIVDGIGHSSGSFTLTVRTADPFNDDCSFVAPLAFDLTGLAVASGDTTDAADSTAGTCELGSGGGHDLVYGLSTVGKGRQNVLATVTYPGSSSIGPELYLRTVCDQKSSEVAGACTRAASGGTLSLDVDLDEGTYYLWVDHAVASQFGPFNLNVQLTSLSGPPTNDTCNQPEALNLVGGVATKTGTTKAATNDYTGTCGTFTGGDTVYSLVLSEPAAVTAKVTATAPSIFTTPAVYIRSANCASAAATDELACAAGSSGSATASFSWLAAGTYYVIVDGASGQGGSYTLLVTTGSPRYFPDTCAQSLAMPPLTFVNGHAEVFEDVRDATDNLAPSGTCPGTSGSGGKDLIYRLDTTSLGTVAFSATVQMLSTYRPAVYLRTTCDSTGTELACASGASTATNTRAIGVASLAPGQYFLVVDGGNSGYNYPFWLSVDLRSSSTSGSPSNDNCTSPNSAQAISFDPVTKDVWVQGTTDGATAETTGTCAAMNGPDVVYSITLRNPAAIYAVVHQTGLSTTFTPGIYLSDGCDAATEKACGTPTNGIAKLTTRTLPVGTYYLFVDGTAGTSGSFDLYVARLDPAPTGACASAPELIFDPSGLATVIGSTESPDATATFTPSCQSGTNKEVVYAITLPPDISKRLVATLVPLDPTATFRGTLALRDRCGATTDVACSSITVPITPNAPLKVSTRNLISGPTGTTYYLWVDTYSSATNAGAFRLTVQLNDAQPPPSNDSCSMPMSLTLTEGTTLTLPSASLPLWLVDDATDSGVSSVCSSTSRNMLGPDVVFTFTLPRDEKFTMTLTPGSTYYPSFYLRKGTNACSSTVPADEVACNLASSAAAMTWSTNVLSADTYFLWVDSSTTGAYNFGTYTLALRIDPPVVVAGDDCRTAIPITTLGTPVVAIGTGAANDYQGVGCPANSNGPELVFSYVHNDPSPTFTVNMAPTPCYDAFLWFGKDTCGTPASPTTKSSSVTCLGYKDANSSSSPCDETLQITGAAVGTTYYFYADAYSASAAVGQIAVTVTVP